jgi:hypothetical protein
MGDIPRQLAAKLAHAAIRLNNKAASIDGTIVSLTDGSEIFGRKVVIATSQPAIEQLLGLPSSHSSISESCLYYAGD